MKRTIIKTTTVLIVMVLAVSSLFAQSYKTYADSSLLNNQKIVKDGIVWIVGASGSFSMNRALEKALQYEFSAKGIKTILSTDKIDISGMEDEVIDRLTEFMGKEIFRYILFVGPDAIYTYTYGEGISRIDTSGFLKDYYSNSEVMIIQMSTEADKNDMLSFNASRDPALKSMAEALVDEYMRYMR